MTFERVAVADASGAILAHSVRLPDRVVHKGTVLTADILAALKAADVASIQIARLGPGDVTEAEAEARLGFRIAGDHLTIGQPTNGRVDLFAARDGIVTVDREAIDGANVACPVDCDFSAWFPPRGWCA